ncbi:MAG: NAD-dependent epimerase/dehydratase family protein [Clostridiaceae bacterium]|jgi:nucleoside-diphosphate-sugar epimerase|nr:NAD-dependent epimerase/dehydratase family protein [Oscillospiraceae bacterium]NLO62531.1 NAD-dependent epimerase/dehydratase family protein [Clostridiaceae bacterium]
MKILVIGGTRYFGKHLVRELVRLGHGVTIATRGLTPDVFGNEVERIRLDRTDRESVKAKLAGLEFDVTYDNINYSPYDTESILECVQTKRYIFTSSSAVYAGGRNLREEDFDPYHYLIRMGRRTDFDYGEGKRLCESVLFQNYKIEACAVRFPIVIGKDDYTRRLYSYVEHIARGEKMNVDNAEARFSMIESIQAGAFLAFLADRKETGPVNAAAKGHKSVAEIVKMSEEILGKEAVLGSNGIPAEFNGYPHNTLSTEKAEAMGFEFRELDPTIRELLSTYAIDFKE